MDKKRKSYQSLIRLSAVTTFDFCWYRFSKERKERKKKTIQQYLFIYLFIPKTVIFLLVKLLYYQNFLDLMNSLGELEILFNNLQN